MKSLILLLSFFSLNSFSNDCLISDEVRYEWGYNHKFKTEEKMNQEDINILTEKGYTVVEDDQAELKLSYQSRCKKRVYSSSAWSDDWDNEGRSTGGGGYCAKDQYLYFLNYGDRLFWSHLKIKETKKVLKEDRLNKKLRKGISMLKTELKYGRPSISRSKEIKNSIAVYESKIDKSKDKRFVITHRQRALKKMPDCNIIK